MTTKLNILVLSWVFLLASTAKAANFDVTKYGAVADQKTDMSSALLGAWKEACAATSPSNVVIPKGTYFLNEVVLSGPCSAPITITLQGTVLANPNPGSFKSSAWITFSYLNQFTLTGGGTFDGIGATAWSQNNCNTNSKCARLPMNLSFNFINNSMIQDVTTKDSKNFHVNVLSCQNLTFLRFTITAPESSINTDGIHMGKSNGVSVIDSSIGTGDDCISLGDGNQNITVKGVNCGPGHGISIGSLGKFANEAPVIGVFVTNCTLTNTQNGVRIKSWPASQPGTVSDVHFEDIIMNNVSNPVLIDQAYCPWNQCNKQQPSRVKISKVSFKNIRGTSQTKNAVNLVCSLGFPCDGVELADINLAYNGPDGPANSTCSNVKPLLTGTIIPTACAGGAATS